MNERDLKAKDRKEIEELIEDGREWQYYNCPIHGHENCVCGRSGE